jgi:hypothetical protein
MRNEYLVVPVPYNTYLLFEMTNRRVAFAPVDNHR